MTWTKLDDGFYDHPKLLEAGGRATSLYVRAICYSNRQGTNGYVPQRALPVLAPDESRPKALAKRLVAAGLWIETGEGYAIADFASHQAHEDDREGAP